MMTLNDGLLVGAGLALLFGGGEALVRGALAIAARLALPPVLIGLTIVGFGTSMPELLVSLDAALRGTPEIALGNVVGSNIANILLIVGVAALVWPIRTTGLRLRRDLGVMLASALVLVPVFWLGEVGRPIGAALVAGLVVYLVAAFRAADDTEEPGLPSLPLWASVGLAAAGLAALLLGARFLVDGAVALARDWGVSEAFIGLTVVALGTSLPELATSLIAALRRQSGLAIGNVIGSNIFNVLAILGLTALVTPVPVAPRFLTADLPVMVLASLILIALIGWRGGFGRITGALMLAGYALYVIGAQG